MKLGVWLEVYPSASLRGLSRQGDRPSVTPSSRPGLLGPSGSAPPLRTALPFLRLSLPPSPPLQVKIFEEDFQRERSDRERMNEEKEELKKQVEKLQAQVTLSNAQVRGAGPRKGLLACPHGEGGGHALEGPGETGYQETRWFCSSISVHLSKTLPLSDL